VSDNRYNYCQFHHPLSFGAPSQGSPRILKLHLVLGALKMLDVKMTGLKLTDQCAGHEIAGHEIAGHKRAGYETVSKAANV